ncbi:MAG: amidohydrolase [Actinomycetota bacterium]|nr:amidohydrolase [Actinomycetota bacterium]
MSPINIVAVRRDLHRYPEPAFTEVRTACIVLEHLRRLSCSVRTGRDAMRVEGVADYPSEGVRAAAVAEAVALGARRTDAEHFATHGTAIVAQFDGNRPGPAWGLRFDMDALPLTESTHPAHAPETHGFRSARAGFMHACGHDGHVAIGLAFAERLAAGDFPGSARLFFQPAEEGSRGAKAMLAASVADGVDTMVTLHLGLDVPLGTVVPGVVGSFATTKLRATFQGAASHASIAPQRGRNAMVAAASAVLNIMAIPRWAGSDTRVNVGTFHAGDTVNIVPALAEITAEARSTDTGVCAEITKRITTIATGAGAMHGVNVSVTQTGQAPALRSDRRLINNVSTAVVATLGNDALLQPTLMGGSDDASLFIETVRAQGGAGVYFIVGADNPSPHHSPAFDIDERSLQIALDVLSRLVTVPAPTTPRGWRAGCATS